MASPSVVYKERQGLPVSTPHVQRARLEDRGPVDAALAVQPAQFVAAADAIDVPISRERQVSAFVKERWAPVYLKTDSTDLATILKASQTLVGWNVTQHSVKEQRRLSAEDFMEVCQTAQIQASDSFYIGYAETIPGNDPVIIDGEAILTRDGTPLTGGTMIKGRQHYNQVTKGFTHWDKGGWEKREQMLAEEASRPVRNVRRAMESYKGELPMWNPVGVNFRRDRRSAV